MELSKGCGTKGHQFGIVQHARREYKDLDIAPHKTEYTKLKYQNTLWLGCLFVLVVFGCPSLSNGQTPQREGESESKRDGHITQAIQHLHAAGLAAEAEQLEKYLVNGQATKTFLVDVQVVELQTKKMQQLGIDWQFASSENLTSKDFEVAIAALQRNHLAKPLAALHYKTSIRRTETQRSENQDPISDLQLKFVSTMLTDERISLDMKLKQGNDYEAEATLQGRLGDTAVAVLPGPASAEGTKLVLFARLINVPTTEQ